MEIIHKNQHLEIYEEIKNDMKFLSNSPIRVKILENLLKGIKSMKDLHIETGLTYSSISTNLHKLQERGYVKSKNKKFLINNLARLKIMYLRDFLSSMEIVNEYFEFWQDHDINEIPKEALSNLNYLKGSQLSESELTNIHKPFYTFQELLLSSSQEIKGIFPFLRLKQI